MSEQDLDRNEDATPHKLQKARQRGQVAKSADVASAVVFIAAMAYLTWQGKQSWINQFRFDYHLLLLAGRTEAGAAELWSLLTVIMKSTLMFSAPFFATLMLSAILGNLLQTGLVLSAEPIKADWKRIDPVAGFRRLFSLKTLFVGARALLKVILLSGAAYLALKQMAQNLHIVPSLSALKMFTLLLDGMASLGIKTSIALGLIALVDLAYSRKEFSRQMKMSKREIKEEFKSREGDPRIRARLRELRREALRRSLSIRNAKNADVMITNPTHVTVALRYVHGQMESPQLIAKGSGVLAAVMRKIAARHNIPVVRNPILARKLFHDLPVDHLIPPELYEQTAKIIIWIFAMRDARNQRAANAFH